MNAQEAQNIKWSENIIIVDGDYIDHVAFDLIVNFERMLNRRIPAADFSQWAVNIALDGRLKPGNHETQVVLLHDKQNPKLENFAPADYAKELNGQAFKDSQLGEFIINAINYLISKLIIIKWPNWNIIFINLYCYVPFKLNQFITICIIEKIFN